MCGRYVRSSDKQEIATRFKLGDLPEGIVLQPDFNIAPSTFQPVIRANKDTGERELVMMRWGMQPNFAESRTAFNAYATINARAERILKNRMWRTPFRRHRCIVPADFYLEWKTLPALEPAPGSRKKPKIQKQPWAYSMTSGRAFGFGALWDAWRDPATGEWLQSFAIITVEANELAAKVHNRMPEIISERDYDMWLDRSFGNTPDELTQLLALLKPFDADLMRAAPANPAVGNVRNNGPEMLDPVPVSADPNEPVGLDSL